ncbi:CBS domain-containing protein [Candidatus Nitrospira bockiana]
MKVREVMTTSPTCCVPTDTASKAARIMKDLDTGIVPIIEDEQNRKLIGVVTDRDLCLEVVAGARDPLTVQVRECMTSALVCCTPEDDVQKAVDLMRDNQVRRIPVVDQAGVIQGIVSMADITQRSEVPPSKTYETLKTVSEATQEASKPRAQMRKTA